MYIQYLGGGVGHLEQFPPANNDDGVVYEYEVETENTLGAEDIETDWGDHENEEDEEGDGDGDGDDDDDEGGGDKDGEGGESDEDLEPGESSDEDTGNVY